MHSSGDQVTNLFPLLFLQRYADRAAAQSTDPAKNQGAASKLSYLSPFFTFPLISIIYHFDLWLDRQECYHVKYPKAPV